MADGGWHVHCVGLDVRGFVTMENARVHAWNHFLAQPERWQDTGASPAPAVFRGRLERGEDETAVLNEAAACYVAVVKRGTTGGAARDGRRGHDPEHGPSAWVVSQLGVFVAFRCGRRSSDLATAYRLEPRGASRGIRVQDYVNRAREKLLRKSR